jgi:hypothetical protein
LGQPEQIIPQKGSKSLEFIGLHESFSLNNSFRSKNNKNRMVIQKMAKIA